VRAAELIMALIMGACSIAVMVKSAELSIGWSPEERPGGGAFPFWLTAGMLVCCTWIVVNWVRRVSAISRSEDPFMDRAAFRMFFICADSLGVMIGLIHFIGVYFAVPLYLIFHLRYVGRHSWALTSTLATVISIVTFFFFEITLHMTLPKGVEAIEKVVFYLLYEMFL
jgi:putative tricarboxylic transport membrane protein